MSAYTHTTENHNLLAKSDGLSINRCGSFKHVAERPTEYELSLMIQHIPRIPNRYGDGTHTDLASVFERGVLPPGIGIVEISK
jgi:hypothetical protein